MSNQNVSMEIFLFFGILAVCLKAINGQLSVISDMAGSHADRPANLVRRGTEQP